MPQNILSQPRTWGTRFDSFISSDGSPPRSPQIETTKTTDASDAATECVIDETPRPKDQRMPHDASIFVGSLPTNIDQVELSRLLSEHLNEHTEVKYIKVIRDSKGGVCAFVQCEDAPSAARLIHVLNTDPVRPFLGRYLRYEPARAFRTLLVSYRTPVQYVDAEASTGDISHERKPIELELPSMMKIWRNRNSKYLSILYNNEAAASESSQDEYAASRGCGLYLSPVLFDAETIHKIALTFGPVESFTSYGPDTSQASPIDDSEDTHNNKLDEKKSYPPPHDGPRTDVMDSGCWEIKWGHRDDAVSALITLRRVPHLTVTWAHQPNFFSFEQQLSSPHASHLSHPSGFPYPIHIASQSSPMRVVGGAVFFNSATPPPSVKPFVLPPTAGEKRNLTILTSKIPTSNPPNDVFSSNSASATIEDDWNLVQSCKGVAPVSPSPSPPVSMKNSSAYIPSRVQKNEMSPTQKQLELTDKDFPPLGPSKSEQNAGSGCWADRKFPKNENEMAAELPSVGSTSPQLSTLATPRASNIDIPTVQAPEAVQVSVDEEGQELDIPPTPEFGMSPNTPKTTGSMMFPHTPSTSTFDIRSTAPKDAAKFAPSYFREEENEIDPTSIFVGGLEMNGPHAWDEERVRRFFSKFGGIEDVKVVFPNNSRSAFAFVKFDNTDAPARAVFQEHNRLHNGRPMRVQLRDRNPSRGIAWRYGRGRGKYPHSSLPRHYLDSTGIMSQETSLEKDSNGHGELQAQILEADSAEEENLTPAAVIYPTLLEHSATGMNNTEIPSESFDRFEGIVSSSLDGQVNGLARVQTPEATSIEYPRSRQASPQSSIAREIPSQYGAQDWNHGTNSSAPLTPAPSSYASSASAATSISYPTSNMGYYQPQPWMPTFAQQFPVPVPFIAGYPGYPLPSHHVSQSFTSSSGSESSAQNTGTQVPWASNGGMYPPFVPYSAYTQPQPQQQQQQQPNAQAPLVPTGFIQGEQGTLIPVYQPEALDQYMTSGVRPPPALPSQSQTQNISPWRQYPQAPSFPFIAIPPMTNQTPAHPGWMPNQPPLVFSGSQPSATTAFRGGSRMNQSGQHHTSIRRHRQSTYDRNIPARPPHTRYAIGGMNNTEQAFNGDHANIFVPHLAFSGMAGPGGWNQWNGGR